MSKIRQRIITLKLTLAMLLMESAARDAARALQAERAENDRLKTRLAEVEHE